MPDVRKASAPARSPAGANVDAGKSGTPPRRDPAVDPAEAPVLEGQAESPPAIPLAAEPEQAQRSDLVESPAPSGPALSEDHSETAPVQLAAQLPILPIGAAQQATLLASHRFEIAIECTHAAARAVEAVSNGVLDLGQRYARQASSAMSEVLKARSPSDLWRIQSEHAHAIVEDMLEESTRWSDELLTLYSDMVEPILREQDHAVEHAA